MTSPSLILYLLNFRKHSSQTELDTFFQKHLSLSDDTRHITKSAFFQARKKLSYTAFIDLNNPLIEGLYKQKQHIKMWQGFRLCAIDGTAIRLPDTAEVSKHFGRHSGRLDRGSCAMGMASVFYDVMNPIIIDSTLQRNKASERDCAAKHLAFSMTNDLLIYDREYPAHWLFQLHKQKGIHFCMRAKTQQSALVKAFIRSGKKDEIVTFSPHYYSALTVTTQVNYKINMARAISKMKHRIVAIISNHRQREKLINRAINYISLTIEAVQKGRSAPRKSNNINNKVHYMACKCSL